MKQPAPEPPRPDTQLPEQAVVDYLTAHPDFFTRHPQLLRDLSLPHDSGNAVSLIERQVELLRKQAERSASARSRGPLPPQQIDYIFGAEGDRIASTALIPLQSEGVLGLLAIGSRDPQRFAPHQGTEFLARLGEIISHTLKAVSLPGV